MTLINRLPTRTWNRLGVNETALSWDENGTTEMSPLTVDVTGRKKVVRVEVNGENEFSRKKVTINAQSETSVTVIEVLSTENNLAVETELNVKENALVRLIQVQRSGEKSLVYNKVTSFCDKNGRVELLQVFPGKGDIYSDSLIELTGDKSSFKSDIGYLGQREQTVDINLVVNHYGKSTESEINASGALKDSSSKIFRGTIDFKTGSSDSVGNEKETVLMLGDGVINKTVPLILCAEENVVGNHGATIGELDDETLFYFESRGIGKAEAENILARAAIERLARETGDEETEKLIIKILDEDL